MGRHAQKTKASRIQILKEMVRALGLNPEEILTKEALVSPHRTVIAVGVEPNYDQGHVDTLSKTLKHELKQEIAIDVPDVMLKTV